MSSFYMPKNFTTEDVVSSITGSDKHFFNHTNKGLLIALNHQLENVSLLPDGGGKDLIIQEFVNPILEEIDKRLSQMF
ncbi:hypothetical protein [Paenibacillus sp. O199]|uniref:hypothetical protein n=1 Tax=Paenibacillus sp. O199 TaxID=1643925 RepID=UPI0007BFD0BA|nr:hypothetical protein [Paenibacillus sp. O199]